MNRSLLIGALMFAAIPFVAMAAEPELPESTAAAAPEAVTVLPEMRIEAAKEAPAPKLCDSAVVKKAEALNNQIKPIKDVVGHIRSPQGFALKMVNDHVFKIPAWVGYAMDPVGSIKHRALDEVKTRAKDAVGLSKGDGESCGAASVEETPVAPTETI